MNTNKNDKYSYFRTIRVDSRREEIEFLYKAAKKAGESTSKYLYRLLRKEMSK